MKNQNIQTGIDLGTTNSEIAINRNGSIEIVKNVLGDEYTPSVFGVSKSQNFEVGKSAYQKLYGDESQNYKAEIKRLMGTSEKIHFSRIDKDLTAEDISAEILKSLKSDVLRKYPDFDATSAVITVPAYFSTLQSEATKRAGNLAGFEHVVMLQEPIAAAIAYGFDNSVNENWLIYDLGGGTFDVALISSKDGVLSVLSHDGDNFLGGKNFDWKIVDEIIIPELTSKYALENFSRSNSDPRVQTMLAKLKRIAETGKIVLTQETKTTLEIDLGEDDNGKEIYFTIDFSREKFENLIAPLITKTIELSLATIKSAGINKKSLSKVILVGGPTQIPYIKSQLATALKVEVDSSVDPLTVVAKGACLYAAGQRIPHTVVTEKDTEIDGVKHVALNFEAMTSEIEELVTGAITGGENLNEDFSIQIQSESGYYNSQKIKLKNGKFFDRVALEKNKSSLFWLYLFDNHGKSVKIDPDSFTITQGLRIAGTPLPHTIGISVLDKTALLNGQHLEKFDIYFEKGSVLPIKKTISYQTARKLTKQDRVNSLLIKVLEGESANPNNNDFVCELGIRGDDLPYDLPEATDIQVTISMNSSRELSVEYYIPSIDKEGNARATVTDEIIDIDSLHRDLDLQRARLDKDSDLLTADDRRGIISEIAAIQQSLNNSSADADEKLKANKQLKELKNKMDKLEKDKEMPQLMGDFNKLMNDIPEFIDTIGDVKDRERNNEHLAVLKKEGENAISSNDKVLMARVIEQLQNFASRVIFSNPETWIYKFNRILQSNEKFSNQQDADYYINKTKEAMSNKDEGEIKRNVQRLSALLSEEARKRIEGNMSGLAK